MNLATCAELPHPPIEKLGWPWQAERTLLEPKPDGFVWPWISIVTPSFNQGSYLEETIRSVLLQGYPNLEYIIIDGGSTDDSVEIIRKYEPWLTYWVSEPDRGQTHAINKGLKIATGEWFNWINSDDLLTPGALARVAMATAGADMVAGGVLTFGENQAAVESYNRNLSAAHLIEKTGGVVFRQPGVWLRRGLLSECGGVDEALSYVFDVDLMIRYLSRNARVNYVKEILACFRLHPVSKTVQLPRRFYEEMLKVYAKLQQELPSPALRRSCRRRIRYLKWREQVLAMAPVGVPARLGRAAQVGLTMWVDPRLRVSRQTLGNIRRILTH